MNLTKNKNLFMKTKNRSKKTPIIFVQQNGKLNLKSQDLPIGL